jgi:hypothetical protein
MRLPVMTRLFSPLLLSGLLLVPLLGQESAWETAFRAYWRGSVAAFTASAERQYADMVGDVGSYLKLGKDRLAVMLNETDPLVQANVEFTKTAYAMTFRERGDKVMLTSDYGSLQENRLHPSLVRERLAVTQRWTEWLRARLKPDEMSLWEKECEKRRARLLEAIPAALVKRVESSTETVVALWRLELDQWVTDAGVRDSAKEAGEQALMQAEKEFRLGFRRLMDRALPENMAKPEYYLSSYLEGVEKRQSFFPTVPGMRKLVKETNQRFAAALVGLMNDAERTKLAKSQAALAKRLDLICKNMLDKRKVQHAEASNKQVEAQLSRVVTVLGLSQKMKEEMKRRLKEMEDVAIKRYTEKTYPYVRERVAQELKEKEREKQLKLMEEGSYWYDNAVERTRLMGATYKAWETVQVEFLTVEQRQLWADSEQKAQDFLAEMWAVLAVSEMDAAVRLNPQQRTDLEREVRVVTQQVAKLNESVDEMLRYNSLEMMLCFFCGLPPGTLVKLLDEDQWKLWKVKSSQAESYWNSIKAKLEALQKREAQ